MVVSFQDISWCENRSPKLTPARDPRQGIELKIHKKSSIKRTGPIPMHFLYIHRGNILIVLVCLGLLVCALPLGALLHQ